MWKCILLLHLQIVNAFTTGTTHHMTENLPFSSGESKDCEMVVGTTLVLNCPQKSFIFNTNNFIKSLNKGTKNYGTDYKLYGVHRRIEKVEQGLVVYSDPQEKAIY